MNNCGTEKLEAFDKYLGSLMKDKPEFQAQIRGVRVLINVVLLLQTISANEAMTAVADTDRTV